MADIKTIGVRDITLDNCIHLLDDEANGSLRGNTATSASENSIAVGHRANASGEGSQAFGAYTIASGDSSHAEGYQTTSSGDFSHAEGVSATASGTYSHAEGNGTIASGFCSHAEGYHTTASGEYSHAEGYGSVARGGNQLAIGRNNIIDNEAAYVFIIGNGVDDLSRANRLTVTWNGDMWIAGALTQGSDKRLKEHIGYLGDDAVEFVRKLKPAHYTKDDASHVGFYAQDVEEEDKWECMVGLDAMGYKTLGYTELIAPLVAYCQHLEKRIEELEKKGE